MYEDLAFFLNISLVVCDLHSVWVFVSVCACVGARVHAEACAGGQFYI